MPIVWCRGHVGYGEAAYANVPYCDECREQRNANQREDDPVTRLAEYRRQQSTLSITDAYLALADETGRADFYNDGRMRPDRSAPTPYSTSPTSWH